MGPQQQSASNTTTVGQTRNYREPLNRLASGIPQENRSKNTGLTPKETDKILTDQQKAISSNAASNLESQNRLIKQGNEINLNATRKSKKGWKNGKGQSPFTEPGPLVQGSNTTPASINTTQVRQKSKNNRAATLKQYKNNKAKKDKNEGLTYGTTPLTPEETKLRKNFENAALAELLKKGTISSENNLRRAYNGSEEIEKQIANSRKNRFLKQKNNRKREKNEQEKLGLPSGLIPPTNFPRNNNGTLKSDPVRYGTIPPKEPSKPRPSSGTAPRPTTPPRKGSVLNMKKSRNRRRNTRRLNRTRRN
jgi:hypothetical protein